jgi:wyosine [tRNA(Phe)-imidazoG37] synthetase (radical SAM superfamily)
LKSFEYKDLYIDNGQEILEIDVLPEKCCNFDCIFCPVGRAEIKEENQRSFDQMDQAIKELNHKMEHLKPDLVYINSKGEALLNDKIDDIIDVIKGHGLNIRLMSNGYLFNRQQFQTLANRCDEVIGELAAVMEEDFQKIQRPMDGYSLENYISNMVAFNQQYDGTFIFEITILKHYNDDNESIEKIKQIIKTLQPDRMNVVRVEKEHFQKKLGITDERFKAIVKELNSAIE